MSASTTVPPGPAGPAPQARDSVAAADVVKVYGRGEAAVTALDGVTVSFEAGRFTAIMGPSGSGKSTLMHCLAGLDSIDAGSVRIGDTAIADLGDDGLTRFRRDHIGFVFQAYNLVPALTVRENVLLPLSLAGRKCDPARLDDLVGSLGIGDLLGRRPSQLSGGQAQRVAVARALVGNPDVVFADEPTGALDTRAGSELLALLRGSCHERGQTIVMVTHDPIAAACTDRVVFLADGRLQGELRDPGIDAVLDHMRALGD